MCGRQLGVGDGGVEEHKGVGAPRPPRQLLALTQAVRGLGGIGKTSIAVEYAHAHRAEYPGGVFWIDADTPATLDQSFEQIAVVDLRLAHLKEEKDARVIRAAVLKVLADASGWLLVADNVDSSSVLRALRERYLPPADAAGHVLITTRAS